MGRINVKYDVGDSLLTAADAYMADAEKGYALLRSHTLDYTGWVDYAAGVSEADVKAVTDIAGEIRSHSDVLVVIGIGGSYLGARAAYDFIGGGLGHGGANADGASSGVAGADGASAGAAGADGVEILFAGIGLSAAYHHALFAKLEGKDFSIVQISKSGGTVEPAMAFLALRELLIKKYGEKQADARTYAVTDASGGILRAEADSRGYRNLIIPADTGGRYSVLTPVGLLPMAAAGIDIGEALRGASDAASDDETAACLRLAAVRRAIQDAGKTVEVIGCFEPSAESFIQWILQLYGESEGKDGKGMLPTGVCFSRDLHSLGQFFQQGNQIFAETFIDVAKPVADLVINDAAAGGDENEGRLFAGRGMNEFNRAVRDGMIKAHKSAGIPVTTVETPDQSAYSFGKLVYFFELTCGVTGLLMGVNPFNQPGVEAYKKEMMAILRG
ncbi:MAG: glucose-6-phosphate isomerase [Clostridiales Family XIII bacterium]|jgi:glucose-6-phosphate isomerase|nr:glucose-6-phosphate isomerase [Clostridiales Family XIII bacterium]